MINIQRVTNRLRPIDRKSYMEKPDLPTKDEYIDKRKVCSRKNKSKINQILQNPTSPLPRNNLPILIT